MDKIRYGIIGCGSMGREHIENLQRDGRRAVVTALADTDAGSRAQASQALLDDTGPQLPSSATRLLASGLCDAVVVATPNFTHVDVMRDALAHRPAHPGARSRWSPHGDGTTLLRRARGARRVWVAQEYRYMPPVAEMIRMAHAGAVGRFTRWHPRAPRAVLPQGRRLEPLLAPTPAARWWRSAATTST
jgi:predicted dehydrogenase